MKQPEILRLYQLDHMLRALRFRILDTLDTVVEHLIPKSSDTSDDQSYLSDVYLDSHRLNEVEKSRFLKEWREAGRL